MRVKVAKWGNSLALRLPKGLTSELGLVEDGTVELGIHDGQLYVKPVPKAYSLDDLLAQMTEENLHGELDWGSSVGAEFS